MSLPRLGWVLGRGIVIGAALAAVVGTGCGTGEYNNRLSATVNNVGRRAAIESLITQSAADAVGGVRLRMPALFDGNAKQVNPGDARSRIGNAAIPGLVRASERAIDDPAGKYSVAYAYFAAAPKEGKAQDAFQNEVQRAVAAALPNAKWETVQIEKLSGGGASFPVLKATGPQPFDATQNGGASEQLEGQLELYLVPTDKQWVLIGWRAPSAHAGKYQFWDSVRAAMSTVEASGGGAAPAPAAPAGEAAAPASAPMAAAANNGPVEGLPPGAVGAAAGIAPLNP